MIQFFLYVGTEQISPGYLEFLRRYWGNNMIALVPVKQSE